MEGLLVVLVLLYFIFRPTKRSDVSSSGEFSDVSSSGDFSDSSSGNW